MSEVLIDTFTNSGSTYRFMRDSKGYFITKKDDKIIASSFGVHESHRDFKRLKAKILRGGENG